MIPPSANGAMANEVIDATNTLSTAVQGNAFEANTTSPGPLCASAKTAVKARAAARRSGSATT